MSLSKIAKISGCSVSTVSKAFHDSNEVSTKTKEKIFKVAQNLGVLQKYYKPVLNYKPLRCCVRTLPVRFTGRF